MWQLLSVLISVTSTLLFLTTSCFAGQTFFGTWTSSNSKCLVCISSSWVQLWEKSQQRSWYRWDTVEYNNAAFSCVTSVFCVPVCQVCISTLSSLIRYLFSTLWFFYYIILPFLSVVINTFTPPHDSCCSLSPSLSLPVSLSLSVSLSVWHHRCVYIAGRWILPWQAASAAPSLPLLWPTAGLSNELEAIPCLHCLFWSAQPSVYDCIHYSCVPLRHTHAHTHARWKHPRCRMCFLKPPRSGGVPARVAVWRTISDN